MNKDTKKADRVGNSVELDSLSWSNTAKFSFFFWYILPGRGCYFSMLRQECSTKNNYGGQGEKREGEGSMFIQRRRIEIKCRSSSSISRYRPTTAGVGKKLEKWSFSISLYRWGKNKNPASSSCSSRILSMERRLWNCDGPKKGAAKKGGGTSLSVTVFQKRMNT